MDTSTVSILDMTRIRYRQLPSLPEGHQLTRWPEDKEKHLEDILRVCTYHRSDWDYILIHSRPGDVAPVKESLQASFTTAPSSGLGLLDQFPAEILHMILGEFDIGSYYNLRQTNRQARILTTSLHQYQAIVKHGLEGYRNMLRTGLAQNFSLMNLYDVLITPGCCVCGEFGGCLFLFNLKRYCLVCLETAPECRVISTYQAAKILHMTVGRLTGMLEPFTLQTVYGFYGARKVDRPHNPPRLLLSFEDTISRCVDRIFDDELKAFHKAKEAMNQRYMATTSFPWYDPKSEKVEAGVCCKGCAIRTPTPIRKGPREAGMVYSSESYLKHTEICQRAEALWVTWEDTGKVLEYPERYSQMEDVVVGGVFR